MSERKVLTKYYPPEWDPSKIERTRKPKGEKAGPKVQTVRLMAPFSMKCTGCGEYIYKGRKFNARKETTEEKYLAITIFRFYIRCTRCSSEITFKTDPKHMDYECERGAKRNFEPWREAKLAEETEEEMLDRLEREEGDKDKMVELEKKTLDTLTEMATADALDKVRMRNAQRERADKEGPLVSVDERIDEAAEREEREIEEQAKLAFQSATGERIRRIEDDDDDEHRDDVIRQGTTNGSEDTDRIAMPPPQSTFAKTSKTKRDLKGVLGIKKRMDAPSAPTTKTADLPPSVKNGIGAAVNAPVLLTGYDSDSD